MMTKFLLLTSIVLSTFFSQAFAQEQPQPCSAKVVADRFFPAGDMFGSEIVRASSSGVVYTLQSSSQVMYSDLNGEFKSLDPEKDSRIATPFRLSSTYFAVGTNHGKVKIYDHTFNVVNVFDTKTEEPITHGMLAADGTVVVTSHHGMIFFFSPDGKIKKEFDAGTFGDDGVTLTVDPMNLSDGSILITVNDEEDQKEHSLVAIFDTNGNFIRKIDHVNVSGFAKINEVAKGVIALNGRLKDDKKKIVVDLFNYKTGQSVKTIYYPEIEYPMYVRALGGGKFVVGVDIQPQPWVFNTRIEFYDGTFTKKNEKFYEKTGFSLDWNVAFVGIDTIAVPVGYRMVFFSKLGVLKYEMELPGMPIGAPVVLNSGLIALKGMHGKANPQHVFFIGHNCGR